MKQRFLDARAVDYRKLLKEIRHPGSRSVRLRERFQEVVSIDFFHHPLREQVERALNALQSPTKVAGSENTCISRKNYQSRLWVTRHRPGVDRVTSAWLITKFIDPKAKFTFGSESDRPAKAVPFDMYEGGFGHRGDDCTFETLVKVFHIRDKSVAVMAEIVHDADLLDEKFGKKEGFGIDEVMKGWAQQGLSDQELLKRGMQLAEGLYRSSR
jgi:hypothetical protein